MRGKAYLIASRLTPSMARAICQLDEFADTKGATAKELRASCKATLYPLNKLGVVDGIQDSPNSAWRWRFTPLGRRVLAALGAVSSREHVGVKRDE